MSIYDPKNGNLVNLFSTETFYLDPNYVGNLQRQSSANYNWLGDLMGSASSGYGGHDDPGGSCFTIDICPDLILAAIVAAAAVAAVLIFNAIVAAGKRKRRSFDPSFGETISEFILCLGNVDTYNIN